jgi:membrane-bound lytic murein transglycosylase D
VVRRGENLTTISRHYGLSVDDLLKMNNLNKRTILRAGQKIRVRADSQRSAFGKKQKRIRLAKSSQKMPTRHIAASSMKHRISRGETLAGIAARYGVPLQDIARANNLKSGNRLLAGQNLVIPAATDLR